MGLLSFISRKARPKLVRLPAGSFTVDRDGHVMTSTLPQGFPETQIHSISKCVLNAFHMAKKAPNASFGIDHYFSALRILARELRGGAIVFLMPASANHPARKSTSD